jgi:membrane-bound lytic murein transglycosylase MltF
VAAIGLHYHHLLPAAPRPACAATDAARVAEPLPRNSRAWTIASDGWRIVVDGVFVVPHDVDTQPAPPAPLLSKFDSLIMQSAQATGFDWRLIAAVIAEESGFDPESRSEKGAFGLMQVMPEAAETVGAEHFTTPEDNVDAGARYLRYLTVMFSPARGADRLKLVLAAYNMGPGHVQDAQMLAQALGYDPYRWDSEMEAVLPLLEDPRFYRALPSGYARAHETLRYIDRVLQRFEHYQRVAPLQISSSEK